MRHEGITEKGDRISEELAVRRNCEFLVLLTRIELKPEYNFGFISVQVKRPESPPKL